VVLVLIECAKDTDASFTRLTIETNHFILVLFALNILLNFDVEDGVVGCHLGGTMQVHTGLAKQLGAIQTF